MSFQIIAAKAVTSLVVGRSVSSVASAAIKNVTPTITRGQELQLMVGTYVMSAMVTEKALEWTGQKFDEVLDALSKFRSQHKDDPTQ